jgi:cadmium resistance protein CadD (predicted permease)
MLRPEILGIFIPIIAIIMGCTIAIVSIWGEHKRKSQVLEQHHRERMHAIEKGIELPPLPEHLLSDGEKPPSISTPAKSLRAGIMLVLVGGLLYFAIERLGVEEVALFGLIPAAIGIANLVYAAIEWSKERRGTDLP